jgi:chromosomal replication initiation ATPase DnaA
MRERTTSFKEFEERLTKMKLFKKIAYILLKKYGVTMQEIYAPGKKGAIAKARAEAMIMVRERFQWSYPAIGNLFNRDSATVLYAIRRHKQI